MSSSRHHQHFLPTAMAHKPKYPCHSSVADDGVDALRESDRLRHERRLDEELAQSLPASDLPSGVRGTTPIPRWD